jgi:hypothetical protein
LPIFRLELLPSSVPTEIKPKRIIKEQSFSFGENQYDGL